MFYLAFLLLSVTGDVTYNITILTGNNPNDGTNNKVKLLLFGTDESSKSTVTLDDPDKDDREKGIIDRYSFSLKRIRELVVIRLNIRGAGAWCYDWVNVRCEECGWSCNSTRDAMPCLVNYGANDHTEFTCTVIAGNIGRSQKTPPAGIKFTKLYVSSFHYIVLTKTNINNCLEGWICISYCLGKYLSQWCFLDFHVQGQLLNNCFTLFLICPL